LPRVFGRYQLFDLVGSGGMAEIYLARARTELGGARLVVVKQILPRLSGNERFSEMLIAEAKLAARLSHGNVVQVFDLGRHEGVLFIAMEYVEGLDLNELLRRCARSKTPLPVPFALLIVVEALQGLDYAHRRTDDAGAPMGIVHRDVSPSNVLISFEGEVKLCDFGIARANDMADLLPEDAIQGKAGYMSPEQARGEPLDARADVFAAGIILWELLAGRKLYRVAEGAPGLLEQARAARIPPLPARNLPLESELHTIVARALAVSRDERFPSAVAMLRQLEDWVGRARLMASPLRFGEWLRSNLGEQIVESRRSRELAAKALERGPVAVIEPVTVAQAPAAAPDDEVSGEREKRRDEAAAPANGPLPEVAMVPRASERSARASTVNLFAMVAVGAMLGLVAVLIFVLLHR
jgi:serine/threonine-protein kinase